jgi:hypothetical protein
MLARAVFLLAYFNTDRLHRRERKKDKKRERSEN